MLFDCVQYIIIYIILEECNALLAHWEEHGVCCAVFAAGWLLTNGCKIIQVIAKLEM